MSKLTSFVNSFNTVYHSSIDLGYVLNLNNEVVAVSRGLAPVFGGISPELGKSIFKQVGFEFFHTNESSLSALYRLVRSSKVKRVYLYIIGSAKQIQSYIVSHLPIMDTNGSCVGIHVKLNQYFLPRFIKLPFIVFNLNADADMVKPHLQVKLTQKQHMVLFLYMRNYSYTEVSAWLAAFGHKVSPTMVNRHLDNIKIALKVTSKQELKQKAFHLGYDQNMPQGFFKPGVYDITGNIFRLKVCEYYPMLLAEFI